MVSKFQLAIFERSKKEPVDYSQFLNKKCNYLAHSSLCSQKGECGSFFGQSPKNDPLTRASEASA
ncbi:MAG: hypothetical protein U5L45_17730 [Saprospiraceae bacterium]|nr:hypothetical protein [Saprospiraceae bacterium]